MIIQASDYIESGFSKEDADMLAPHINAAVAKGEVFTVDFEGVEYFTTLFFGTALTYLIGDMGILKYKKIVHIINLTPVGEDTYLHALEYAEQYYKKTKEEQEAERIIMDKETESM